MLNFALVARAQSTAYEYFDQAARILDQVDFRGQRSPRENIELIQRNAPALALIGRGLTLTYHPLPEADPALAPAGYARWGQLARFVKASGDARAAQDDWQGAIDDYLDTIKLGIEVTRGGPMMDLLVGQVMQATGRRPLEESLAHLDAAAAQHAARRLETIVALSPAYADTMRAEAALGATLLEENLPIPNKDAVQDVVREYRQLLQRQIEDAARPYILTRQKPAFTDVDAVQFLTPEEAAALKELPDAPTLARMTFKMAQPIYENNRLRDALNRTQNQMLLAVLALRAYHAANGKYPATLAELVPTYLEKVPADPFGLNSPLIYKNAGQEYSLYSVGADGKDDGGRAVKNGSKIGGQEYSARLAGAGAKGDIVFGVND
jgi:hypothetical protein